MISVKSKLFRLAQFIALVAGICFCSSLSVNARKCSIGEGCESYIYKEDNEFGTCYRLRLSQASIAGKNHYPLRHLECLQISKLCGTKRDFYALVDSCCIHVNLDTEQGRVLAEEPSGLDWQLPEVFWKTRKR